MACIPRKHAEDWLKASDICRKYKNLECLQATADLMNTFRDDARVIYACTLERASRPFICHPSLPNDVISENGNHFAVLLHDKVFDNLHPDGESFEQWKLNFEFAAKGWTDATFEDEDLTWWRYDEFLGYLKKCKRTKLGRPRTAYSNSVAKKQVRNT